MSEDLEKLAREAEREYHRQWRAKNPEKTRAARQRYWQRRAARLQEKGEKEHDGEHNEN